jgi:hypothetical protein
VGVDQLKKQESLTLEPKPANDCLSLFRIMHMHFIPG